MPSTSEIKLRGLYNIVIIHAIALRQNNHMQIIFLKNHIRIVNGFRDRRHPEEQLDSDMKTFDWIYDLSETEALMTSNFYSLEELWHQSWARSCRP